MTFQLYIHVHKHNRIALSLRLGELKQNSIDRNFKETGFTVADCLNRKGCFQGMKQRFS